MPTLTTVTALAANDLIVLTTDPPGNAPTKKITLGNIAKLPVDTYVYNPAFSSSPNDGIRLRQLSTGDCQMDVRAGSAYLHWDANSNLALRSQDIAITANLISSNHFDGSRLMYLGCTYPSGAATFNGGAVKIEGAYDALDQAGSGPALLQLETSIGYGGSATQGSYGNLTSTLFVRGVGHASNEYSPVVTAVSLEIGTGYAQSAGPTGRVWGADHSVHGSVDVQPGLLNGMTQLINNYYNGSPADSPSGAVWIVTRPGSGAGLDSIHSTATTYATDVALGIAGASTGGGIGFTTALQIGGHGSGWMGNTERSYIGTGIDLTDWATAGIYVHAATPGATGPAFKTDGYMELLEMTAPSPGAVNTCRLYVEDNGAGKTRLMALFNSGAAQQVAIQP